MLLLPVAAQRVTLLVQAVMCVMPVCLAMAVTGVSSVPEVTMATLTPVQGVWSADVMFMALLVMCVMGRQASVHVTRASLDVRVMNVDPDRWQLMEHAHVSRIGYAFLMLIYLNSFTKLFCKDGFSLIYLYRTTKQK